MQGRDNNSFDCPVSDWRDPCGRDCAQYDVCIIFPAGPGSYLDCGGETVQAGLHCPHGLQSSDGAPEGLGAGAIVVGLVVVAAFGAVGYLYQQSKHSGGHDGIEMHGRA